MIIVNAIIIEKEKILTVKRKKKPYIGMYGLPGGHVEPGESQESALIRELKEETNSEIEIQSYIGMVKNKGYDVYFYKAKIKSIKLFKENSEIREIKWLKIDDFIDNLKKYFVENVDLIEKFVG